ncbi:MAG: hypothetical protein BWX71_02102 [Deltaproteobacteria bacterium ADurb.Bin072]|nr:MAG: hypothetical protein BWX71_02102 [Deltaproteobacteria bacterium ADurb.Bin072]
MTYKDVQRLTGVKRTALQAWIEKGFIDLKGKAKGTGYSNDFTMTDIENIMLFKRATQVGLSRELTARLIKKERKKLLMFINSID